MPGTTSVPFINGNRVINAFKFNQVRVTIPENPKPIQRIHLEGSVSLKPLPVLISVLVRV